MSFALEFRGRLNRWLKSQGLDVVRITSTTLEYEPSTQQGWLRVSYLDSSGVEDFAKLPPSLDELFKVL